MNTFEYWKKRFDNNDLLDFSRTEEGLLWLKLRSIARKDLLSDFCTSFESQAVPRLSVEHIWESMASAATFGPAIDRFLKACQMRENAKIDASQETIRANLYKMSHFHWGGGFRNSLDKAIVSRYVKTDDIIPFDRLDAICDGELFDMSRGYLLNSWYNYWSSVLIENIFRRNAGVLPAYGKIKNVDFFVDDFPFDLKVTYIPKEYAELVRKRLGIEEPLKILKKFAKERNIPFSDDASPEQVRYEIIERLKDSKSKEALSILSIVKAIWTKTVSAITSNKQALIKWLYENQGDMRFGAENRIFLVLIDMENPDESWKLKRNVDLISPLVSKWVSHFKREKCNDLLTNFSYKSQLYETYADMIFAVKK
ncbi:MAG: hypothetical protein ILM98_08690 [Kiritimatiellae bacterium]|nr:hypothetical protein [Kiritimatiellia bacterium]